MDSNPATMVPTGHAAVHPETKKPHGISINGFRVSTQKLPILKAEPIEEMTRELGIAPPEMIFGDNYVAIEHEKGDWGINFNAFDALDLVDKTGQSMLQVAYSKEWQKSRYARNSAYIREMTAETKITSLTGRTPTRELKKSSSRSTGHTAQTTRVP